MGLHKCPDCGKKVSNEGDRCTNCGRPVRPEDIPKEGSQPFAIFLALIFALIAWLALSDGDDPAPSTVRTNDEASGIVDRISPATTKQLEWIAFMMEDGPEFDNHGCTVGRGWRLRSSTHGNADYVAGEIVCTGVGDPSVGVWLIGATDESVGVAADAMAREFSKAPDGRKTKASTEPTNELRALRQYALSELGRSRP